MNTTEKLSRVQETCRDSQQLRHMSRAVVVAESYILIFLVLIRSHHAQSKSKASAFSVSPQAPTRVFYPNEFFQRDTQRVAVVFPDPMHSRTL